MKKSRTLILGLLLLFMFIQPTQGQNYDYLKSATATGSGTTTDNSQSWTDVVSVTIDVTNVNYVHVAASMNMRPDGDNTGNRTAIYNIYRSDLTTDKSGIIRRQVSNSGESGVEGWGIGTLVHIFDVSTITGDKTFVLEHSNGGTSADNSNVFTSARLTAISLTTAINEYNLGNDVKRLDADVTIDTFEFAAVAGLTTDAISLPLTGDFYVTASINGKADESGSIAEYKLQYSADGGTNWTDFGKSVHRSMMSSSDDGIVSLVGLLLGREASNNFKFRVAHRLSSGVATITTHNSNLVAIALTHNGGGYFPAFYKEVDATGVEITGVGTPPETVTSTTFTAAADINEIGTGLFINTQFLVNGSNLDEKSDPKQRMRAGNQLCIKGASEVDMEEYYRYLPNNDNMGSGGFIGLMSDLEDGGSYTIGMKHQIDYVSNPDATEDEILTTSQVILCGFQTYDQPYFMWNGSINNEWGNANNWPKRSIPTSTSDVFIPSVSNNPVIAYVNLRECNDITIESGATLTIEDYGNLTVLGDLSNSGTLTLESTTEGTGSLIVDGAATGDVVVHRFITSNVQHLVTPLTTGTQSDDFYIDETHDIQLKKYNEADGDGTSGSQGEWESIVDLGVNLSVGTGYSYFVDGTSSEDDHGHTLSFTGGICTTDLLPAITYEDENHGFNLSGNPFTSSVLWDTTWTRSNVEGTIWLWNDSSNNYTVRTIIDTFYIPTGQGFFVKATAANPAITIPKDNRVHSSQILSEITTSGYENYTTIRAADDNQYWDEVKVSFHDNGTEGFDDGWDASKMFGPENAPQLYLVVEERNQSFNHLPLIDEGYPKTVAMSYIAGADGDQTLTADTTHFSNNVLLLEDLEIDSTHNLKLNTVYNFAALKSDTPERFLIHFTNIPDGINDLEQISNINIYSYGKNVYIRSLNSAINQNANVFIYDMLGREIVNTKIHGYELEKIGLDVSDCYVIVKVVKDSFVKTEKVFIK